MRSPLAALPLSVAMFRNGFFSGPLCAWGSWRRPNPIPSIEIPRGAGVGVHRLARCMHSTRVTARTAMGAVVIRVPSPPPRDGQRRDDPLTDHDAAGAGIGELARSQRLQAGDVRNLVRRDHNTGGASI